jgi:hypothetical protein
MVSLPGWRLTAIGLDEKVRLDHIRDGGPQMGENVWGSLTST